MFYVLNFLCLLLMNAPNVYATSGHLIDHNKENLSSMFINEITMNLTPTTQTCTGNGKINVSIGNTEPGAQFIIQVYQLPNQAVPIQTYDNLTATGSTFEMEVLNLPNGEFKIVAIQEVGSESNQIEATSIVANNVQDMLINYQLTYACGNVADVNVTHTSGNIVSYQLMTSGANPTVARPWQNSNIFDDVSVGNYVIYAKDICDNVVTQGFLVIDKTPTYTYLRDNLTIYSHQHMSACNMIMNRIYLNQLVNGVNIASTDNYRYPITITIETQNPTGGAPNVQVIIINNALDATTKFAYIPFYPNYSYTTTYKLVDNCGNIFDNSVIINNSKSTSGKGYVLSQAISGCSRFLKFDDWLKFYGDTTIEIVSAPAGFDASNYNSNFTPGSNSAVFPMTGTLNTPGVITIGSEMNSLPNGTYVVRVTNCGVVINKTIVIGSGTLPTYFYRNSASCVSQNHGGTIVRIGTEDGIASKIIMAKIVSGPQEFINEFGPLPYDVSSYIGNGDNQEGELFLYEVPQGTCTSSN